MRTKTKQILLADDNDANRLIARTILERAGYDVTSAENGAQALGLAKLNTYNLIVLDIMMPVMDGMRALRELRRDTDLNKETPVFALTAFCSAEDQQRYLLAGFDYVLSKPLRPGDIETALSHYKNRRSVPARETGDDLSLMTVNLIDETMTTEISNLADPARLDAIQSRFWISIVDQCKIIEMSLPDAMRGDGSALSQFRRAVHAVKGASTAIGLERVSYISRRLQNAPPPEIPSLMRILTDALTLSRPALKHALTGARELNISMEMRRQDETEASHHDENYSAAI